FYGLFYGLFMDRDVLRESGVIALHPRRAYVDGYALRIGRRATLIPSPEGRAYGIVFAMTHNELDQLYSAPGLGEYRPEAMFVRLLEGDPLRALCYNLRDAPQPGEANEEYAERLRAALTKLGFPSEYVESVE
ncbi:MAG: gamma-glutamylcyclotransferase, partial [Gammaproteobacteria bacterium]|nr:gamma-glutamylcyclotransferase [Gammaproteobacteria bacterium]